MNIQRLDPNAISSTIWAIDEFLSDVSFQTLKTDIESNGGNVAPIKVRPSHTSESQYEIVFGHRRHRACLELGLDVLSIVEQMDDSQLVQEMDRENRCRFDPSGYGRGSFFLKALDRGLFSSARRMAEQLGVDLGTVTTLLSLARLPSQIIVAFKKPSQIKPNWAKKISNKLARDPELVLARANQITLVQNRMTAAQIYSCLSK